MTVLERLRTDLTGRRSELMVEEKRLMAELTDIRQALAGIDQVLGAGRPAPAEAGKPQSGSAEEREQLRRLMVKALMEAGTAGLTSYDLLKTIEPEWTGAEVTARRIGANAAQMPEVTGDGQRWYYVPAPE